MAIVAPHDPTEAAREPTRAVTDLGFVGLDAAYLDPRSLPERQGIRPDLRRGDRAGSAHRHAHGRRRAKRCYPRFPDFLSTHATAHPFEQMAAVCSFVVGGILERHPTLQVAFLESGIGWVPF